ncbi:hypothetical protein HDU79_011625 [Rhizoclosmatium sp. JEL0117]|nr:hypothetical protein HDU79_011625 [Rhizoclosmatium sp. JEL0117]
METTISALNKSLLQSLPAEIIQLIFRRLPFDGLLEFCLTSKTVYIASPIASMRSANTFVKLWSIQSGIKSIWQLLEQENLAGDNWVSLPFPLQAAVFHQTLIAPDNLKEINNYPMFTMSNKYLMALVKAVFEGLNYQPTNQFLCWACELEHIEVVDICLKNPLIDVSGHRNAALDVAHASRNSHIVKLLLKDPRFDRMNFQRGITYLNLLCLYGMYEELQSWILDPRIDPSVDNSLALYLGVDVGHLEIVDILLSDGRANPNDRNVLQWGAKKGRVGIVERILQDSRVDPSLHNNFALLSAVGENHTPVIQRLLSDSRINVTRDDNALFIEACRCRFMPLIKALLLDGRSDPTARENQALKHAIRHHHSLVIDTLLADPRIDPKFENCAILSMSVPNYLIRTFLRHSRMNLLSESARVLVEAINNNRSDIVQLFLWDGQINPCAENLAALVSAVTAQSKTISMMLLSDERVITVLSARPEYYENVIGGINVPREFRSSMVEFLIQRRLSHLTLLFGVKTQEKRVFQGVF